ncbi:MAG: peptidyl-prolyl cis-trans isomerase [Verrucomicrobiota bacterium]
MEITVNDEVIPASLFEQERDRLHMDENSPPYHELEDIVRDNLVSRTLIRQAAKKAGIEISAKEIDESLADLKEEAGSEDLFYRRYGITSEQENLVKEEIDLTLQVEKFLEEITKDVAPPTDAEIEEYFQQHQAELSVPEEIEASHIVKNVHCEDEAPEAFNEMREVRKKLVDGADFAETVAAHSDAKDNNGELGRFQQGQILPELETIAFSMSKGEISPVFPSQFGYHIVKVTDHTPARPQTLDEARNTVREKILYNRKNKTIEEWVDTAESKATISIREEAEESS